MLLPGSLPTRPCQPNCIPAHRCLQLPALRCLACYASACHAPAYLPMPTCSLLLACQGLTACPLLLVHWCLPCCQSSCCEPACSSPPVPARCCSLSTGACMCLLVHGCLSLPVDAHCCLPGPGWFSLVNAAVCLPAGAYLLIAACLPVPAACVLLLACHVTIYHTALHVCLPAGAHQCCAACPPLLTYSLVPATPAGSGMACLLMPTSHRYLTPPVPAMPPPTTLLVTSLSAMLLPAHRYLLAHLLRRHLFHTTPCCYMSCCYLL